MTPAGDTAKADGGSARLVFRRRHRLTHARQFQAVYAAKVRKTRGPLTVFAAPNELGHHRLGLSVGRAVGTAVERNRVKRMLREAFRLDQRGWMAGDGGGYDLVVTVRRHAAAPLEQYRAALGEAVAELDREWHKRHRRVEGGATREEGAS